MKKLFTWPLLLMFSMAFAQKKPVADSRFQGLDAELEQVLKDWKAAGFAVAVVEKDKVVYAKGFGVRDIKTRQPITTNTLFAIGSCTKAFTATLVGQLVADGKLTYDEPVRNYFPELKFYNGDMNNLISMRDMMSHKTGLPRHDLSWYFNQSDNRDSLIQRIQYMEPTYKPKEKYQYNNFMFLAQGKVVEKFTRQSWELNMREKIFKPLGMERSNMPYSAVKADSNLASPHSYKNDSTLRIVPHYNIAGMGPAGAVYSSVLEMSKWVQTWIYGGKYNGVQVVPPAHFKEATTAQSPMGAGIPDKEHPDIMGGDYGFGWMLSGYRGHYQVEHGGAIDGFIASTCFFPNDSIGIVVLSNQDSRIVPAVVRRIISDRMLGLSKINWNQQNLDAAAKARKQADSAKTKASFTRSPKGATHEWSAYEGIYNHPGYGSYEVFVKNDSLFLSTRKSLLWLMNWHYDVFYPFEVIPGEKIDTADKGSISFRFNTSVNGEIESMNVYGFEAPTIELVFKKTPKPKALTKAELEGYTGEYDLGGVAAKVYIKGDNTLFVEVPGQPPYELVYTGNDKFVFKLLSSYAVQFDKKAGEAASAVTFLQPQGNFTAKRKK